MYNFLQQAESGKSSVQFKAQRDPRSYMGLERMLLQWVKLMAFVVSTSMLLLQVDGVAAQVLRYVWLPFAALGVAYATWKYYTRLSALQAVPARRIPIGSDPWAYTALLALLIGTLMSYFIVTALTWTW